MRDYPKIETVYRVFIHWETSENTDPEAYTRIQAKADALATTYGVELTSYTGSPACGPYFEAESNWRSQLEGFTEKLCNYLRRFKGVTIELDA